MILSTKRSLRRQRRSQTNRPSLRFTPYAWAKLLNLRDAGPTEVGGFGITSEQDLLLVEDVRLVQQVCSRVTVKFDDAAVADHFDRCVDAGLPPERFARVWIHTHPGASAQPSNTDEETFTRVFGGCDWAVMAILAQGGESYARLRFNAGPGGELIVPVNVDFNGAFAAADQDCWAEEYAESVHEEEAFRETLLFTQRRDLAGSGSLVKRGLSTELELFDDLLPESRIWEFHDEHDCFADFDQPVPERQ